MFYTVCDTLVYGVVVMRLVVTTLEYCVVVVVIVDSTLIFFLLLVVIVGVTFRDDDYFIVVLILNISDILLISFNLFLSIIGNGFSEIGFCSIFIMSFSAIFVDFA